MQNIEYQIQKVFNDVILHVSPTIQKLKQNVKNLKVDLTNCEFTNCYNRIYSSLENFNNIRDDFQIDQSEKLDQLYEDYIFKTLHQEAKELNQDLQTHQNEIFFLQEFVKSSKIYIIFLNQIRRIFYCIDAQYYKFVKLSSIFYVGHQIYVQNILKQNLQKIVKILNDQIKQQNKQYIQICYDSIQLIYSMGFDKNLEIKKIDDQLYFQQENIKSYQEYMQNFENQLIKIISDDISEKAVEQKKNQLNLYVNFWMEFQEKELEKADQYYPYSKDAVNQTILNLIIDVEIFVKLCADQENGFIQMIEKKKEKDVQNLYQFLSQREEGLQILVQLYQDYLEKNLKNKLDNQDLQQNPIKYINYAISLYKDIEIQIKTFFQNNYKMINVKDNSMRRILNEFQKFPLFLAQYCDDEMQNSKIQDEQEMKDKLDMIILLFKLMFSKDIFMKDYEICLGRRLIKNKSTSFEKELNIIQLLKQECGATYVNKLEIMLQDIKGQQNLDKQFQNYLIEDSFEQINFEFKVLILTQGIWPEMFTNKKYQGLEQKCFNIYDKFYQEKFKSIRILNFQTFEGLAEMYFLERKYLLILNTKQLMILQSLKNDDTVASLNQKIQIPQQDFRDALFSFLKTQVLIKDPKCEEIKDSDKIKINMDFKSEQKKINLSVIKPLKQKNQQFTQSNVIDKNRDFQIDSTIIRLMKGYKESTLQNLIMNVIAENPLFKCSNIQVKQRIESLMERNYIGRSENDQNIMQYLP